VALSTAEAEPTGRTKYSIVIIGIDGRREELDIHEQKLVRVSDLKDRLSEQMGFPAEGLRVQCGGFDKNEDTEFRSLYLETETKITVRILLSIKGGGKGGKKVKQDGSIETKDDTENAEEHVKNESGVESEGEDSAITREKRESKERSRRALSHIKAGMAGSRKKGLSLTGDPSQFKTARTLIDAVLYGCRQHFNRHGPYKNCEFVDEYEKPGEEGREMDAWRALTDENAEGHLRMVEYNEISYSIYTYLVQMMSKTDMGVLQKARTKYGQPKEYDGFGTWRYITNMQRRKTQNSADDWEERLSNLVYTEQTFFDEFETSFLEAREGMINNGSGRTEKDFCNTLLKKLPIECKTLVNMTRAQMYRDPADPRPVPHEGMLRDMSGRPQR
jgi:hypothetical protein